jgi:hypothetical protein
MAYNTPIPGLNVPSWEVGGGLSGSALGFANFTGIDQLAQMVGIGLPTDMISGSANLGGWQGDDGFRVGARVGAGVIPKQDDLKWGDSLSPLAASVLGPGFAFDPTALRGEVEAVSGEAELSLGNDGFTGGAQVTLGGVGATMGDFGDVGVGSESEQQLRVGVNAGVGAAGRLHWTDEDGDGNTEWGFGVDYGPGSMDFKTEDPLRSIAGLGFADSYLPQGNLTYQATDWAHDSIMAGGDAVVGWINDWMTPDNQGLDPISPPSGEQLMPEEGIWY